MLARGLEARGIATTYVGVMRDLIQVVRPPRAAFVNFPPGHPCGKPFDKESKLAILRDALSLLESAKAPGTLRDLPYEWDKPFTFAPGSKEQPTEICG